MSKANHNLIVKLNLALLLVVAAWPAHGQSSESDRIGRIKAGMILNFVRFTEWPAHRFASEGSPIVITVLGRDDMNPILEQAVSGQTAHDRPIQVVRLQYPQPQSGETSADGERIDQFVAQLRSAHLLYIADTEASRLRNILQHVDGADVLTVSDIAGFAERGGMLGFAVRGGRMCFDANVDAIEATNVKVSSKVLRLARIVKRES